MWQNSNQWAGDAVLTKDVAKIAKLVPTEAELVNLRAPFLASVA